MPSCCRAQTKIQLIKPEIIYTKINVKNLKLFKNCIAKNQNVFILCYDSALKTNGYSKKY